MNLKVFLVLALNFFLSLQFIAQTCVYGFKKTITINSSQVAGTGSHTDFPVLLHFTDADLILSPGGNVENANGFDIIFQETNGNALDFDLESYNSATGEIIVWVKIPSLSTSVDTQIEMLYGNASIGTNQSTNAFNSNYQAAWHMNQDPSIGLVEDATGQGVSGEPNGTMTSADLVAGKIGNCLDFDGSNDRLALANLNYASTNAIAELSVTGWVNTSVVSGSYSNNWAVLDFDRSEYFNVYIHGDGRLGFSTREGGINDFFGGTAGDLNDGNWHHIAAVYDGTDKLLYIDGALVATQTNPHGGGALGTGTTRYGYIADGSEANGFSGSANNIYYDGMLDEIHYATSTLSADWIATEFNNQDSPATFATLGVEESLVENCNCYVYKFKRTLTINSAQVIGAGSHTDFPVLFSMTDNDFRSVANGGHVESEQGHDFYFQLTDMTPLDFQLEHYDPVNGEVVAWIKIPSLSTSADTDFEILYGNTGILASQSSTQTWSSDYDAVWHMAYDPLNSDQLDGTSNGYDGQTNGSMNSTDLVTGQIGNAVVFDGTNDFMALSDISYSGAAAIPAMTVSCWVNTTHVSGGSWNNWAIVDFDRSEYFNFFIHGDGRASFATSSGGAISDFYTGGGLNDGNWHQLVAVYDGTDKHIYIDGALVGTQTNPHGGSALGSTLTRYGFIGDGSEASNFNGSRNGRYFEGTLDEIRLLNVARNANWLATEYNNQNAPGTFITAGAEVDNRNTWLGSTSDWFSGTNWSSGVPDIFDEVVIPTGLGTYPSITGGKAFAKAVEIESGASLTIATTDTLAVSGDLRFLGTFTPNNGVVQFLDSCAKQANFELANVTTLDHLIIDRNDGVLLSGSNLSIQEVLGVEEGTLETQDLLVLLSNATATARVTAIGAEGDIKGDVEVQRYINGGNTNWRFLTAPVQNAILEDWDDDFITSGFPGTDYPTFPTASNPFESMSFYDETASGDLDQGFVYPSSTSDPINMGQGVWVWCGDFFGGTNPFTIDVFGPLYIGDQDLPVSFTSTGSAPDDGWCLVANPYACTIDWESTDWTKTNINSAIYVWNPDLVTYASYVPGMTPGTGVSTNGGSRYIASAQAFYIQTNAGSPQLTITENCKYAEDQAFIKSTTDPVAMIKLQVEKDGLVDETVIRLTEFASDDFDGHLDARKVFSYEAFAPQISSKWQSDWYSINSIPAESATEMNIDVRGQYGDTMNLVVAQVDYLEDACLFLEDLVTGDFMEVVAGEQHQFVVSSNLIHTRFKMTIVPKVTTEVVEPACFGESNGYIVAENHGLQGDYDFYWEDQSGMIRSVSSTNDVDTLSGLSTGWYYVSTSNNMMQCDFSADSVFIGEPAPIELSVEDLEHVSCVGCCDGEASVVVSGGNSPYDYEWSNGDMGSGQFNLCVADYTVLVTDNNGCEESVLIEVGSSASVNETISAVRVFPNPAKDMVYVDWDELGGDAQYTIRSVEGKTVAQGTLTNRQIPLQLVNGTYYLTLSSSGRMVTTMVVIDN
jgi:hypothetical protein